MPDTQAHTHDGQRKTSHQQAGHKGASDRISISWQYQCITLERKYAEEKYDNEINVTSCIVKAVHIGGYGLLIGPHATESELEDFRQRLLDNPSNYISQPVIDLSVAPTLCDAGVEARHVDLRPFALTGKSTWVLPGGLSRVALRKGSLVVNSSQGGGSKDTWVMSV